VDNWKNITNSQNSVRKKSYGRTFCFSNCHIIGLDTGGLVFLWPVHLNDKNVSSREDTFLSWHLAPALEVAGGHTLPFKKGQRAWSADSKMVR
jgi:hypothetical protein